MEALNWGKRMELVQIESRLTWKDLLTLLTHPQLKTACLTTWLGIWKAFEIEEGIPFHLEVHIWPQKVGLELDFINSFFFFLVGEIKHLNLT